MNKFIRASILFFILLLSFSYTYSQNQLDFYKLKSPACRLEEINDSTGYLIPNGKNSGDFMTGHLIVLNNTKTSVKIYSTYSNELVDEINLISKPIHNTKKSVDDFIWNGINERGVKCDVQYTFLDDKPLFVRLTFMNYRTTYFIK